MQFSLRTLLYISVAIGIATSWYIVKRQGELGLKISLPSRDTDGPEQEKSIPEAMVEFSDDKLIREHERQFHFKQDAKKVRLQQLRQSLSTFSLRYELDEQLIKDETEAISKIAYDSLNDQAAFKSAANAALILDKLGDKNAFDWICGRYLRELQKDDGLRQMLFDIFPNDRLTEVAPILAELKSNVDFDTPLGRRAKWILFGTGIDREPLVDEFKKSAKDNPSAKWTSNLSWLVKNASSTETLSIVEKYLGALRADSQHLLRAVLSQDFTHSESLQSIANRIEFSVCEQLRNGQPTHSHTNQQLWYVLAQKGSQVSKPFFSEILNNPNWQRKHMIAINALERLGYREEVIQKLRQFIAKSQPECPTLQIPDNAQNSKRANRQKYTAIGNYTKLATMLEGTSDSELIEAILEKLYCKGRGWYHIQALHLLEKVGYPGVKTLWERLPDSQLSNSLERFDKNWRVNDFKRRDIVDWINQHIESPDSHISLDKIITAPRYHPDIYSWQGGVDDMKSPYEFAMFALACSSSGNFTDGENYDLLTFGDLFREIVPDHLPNFQLTSHSCEYGTLNTIRIVVNNRLYQFLDQPSNPDWGISYDVQTATDILNIIAERHGCKERFFLYDAEFTYSFRLVLFLHPSIAANLAETFKIIPIGSSDRYLDKL